MLAHKKANLCINLATSNKTDLINKISTWLNVIKPSTLNIAGPRSSSLKDGYKECYKILISVFKNNPRN